MFESLENLHIHVFGCANCNALCRTLCDKYILSYDGFSWFLIGKFRHSVLICGVGVEWDSRSTAAYVHSILIVFTPFYTTFLLKF